MVVLALETVSRAGSLSLWRDGLCGTVIGDGQRSHAERLPAEVMTLLDAHGLTPRDVSLYAVVTGPGSFTGLRVGVAATQGLALAGRTRALGIPTLDALLASHRLTRDEDAQVVACLDGQRGEVFLSAVEAVAGRALEACRTLVAPAVATPGEAAVQIVRAVDPDRPLVIVGDGGLRYADVFRGRLPWAEFVEAPRPLAEGAAVLAAARAAQATSPHALRAVYLRRPDVVIKQEAVRLGRVQAGGGAWRIRRASTQADLQQVERLQLRTFTNPWNADSIRWELENSDVARLYLLEDTAGTTLAYCACWIVYDELHINSLAVDPDRRRQGIARALLHHVMTDASSHGAASATLEVRASNEPARRLYEALGFRVEGVRRDYYRDPREDALILWHRRLA
jgi:ribosomal-protein-alanine N-acetyltransferase